MQLRHLVEGYDDGELHVAVGSLDAVEEGVHAARDDPLRLALPYGGAVHGPALTRRCLAVCHHRAIEAAHHAVHHAADLLEDLSLSCLSSKHLGRGKRLHKLLDVA